jgi:hypothetical protein
MHVDDHQAFYFCSTAPKDEDTTTFEAYVLLLPDASQVYLPEACCA